jgi:Mlc titration factor MtfA (ptsG expression regulator)
MSPEDAAGEFDRGSGMLVRMWFTRRGRERRARLEAGFTDEWRELCARRFRWWRALSDDERARLEDRALALVVGADWEAANGFEVTDEMIGTIAVQAALLILELPEDSYRDVHSVIVHPSTVVLEGEHSQVDGLVSDDPMPIDGQAEYHGPVLVAWDEVLDEARHPGHGRNVVFHEFAHKLDMLDGTIDGTPSLGDPDAVARWVEVCTRVFDAVAEGRGGHVLSPYAGVNAAEFFAVATEAFFDDPRGLRHEHPDLYDVLADFYGQDPVARTPGDGAVNLA